MQQIYRRTPTRKCRFGKVANQLYWNHTSAWVFFCKFASYLHDSRFDKHLWGATSANVHSICLPYFPILIRVRFGLVSSTFLTSSMSSSQRAVLRLPEFSLFLFRFIPWTIYWNILLYCLFARWCLIESLSKCCLNCYVAFSFFFLQQKLVLLLIFEVNLRDIWYL